jgi:hypothetical protein
VEEVEEVPVEAAAAGVEELVESVAASEGQALGTGAVHFGVDRTAAIPAEAPTRRMATATA